MGTQGNGPVSGMGPEGVAGVSLLALGEGGSLHGASPHHGQSIWGVLMIGGSKPCFYSFLIFSWEKDNVSPKERKLKLNSYEINNINVVTDLQYGVSCCDMSLLEPAI